MKAQQVNNQIQTDTIQYKLIKLNYKHEQLGFISYTYDK
mgnify:CR=1 FL=1